MFCAVQILFAHNFSDVVWKFSMESYGSLSEFPSSLFYLKNKRVLICRSRIMVSISVLQTEGEGSIPFFGSMGLCIVPTVIVAPHRKGRIFPKNMRHLYGGVVQRLVQRTVSPQMRFRLPPSSPFQVRPAMYFGLAGLLICGVGWSIRQRIANPFQAGLTPVRCSSGRHPPDTARRLELSVFEKE